MLKILEFFKYLIKYLSLTEKQLTLVLLVSIFFVVFVGVFEIYNFSGFMKMLIMSSFLYMCLLAKITDSFIKGFIYSIGLCSIYVIVLMIACGFLVIKEKLKT